MKLLYVKEHLNCHNYEVKERAGVEVTRINKEESKDFLITSNKIIFFMEGRIKIELRNFRDYEGLEGHFVFLPAGNSCHLEAMSDSQIIIFRLVNPINLCDTFSLEKLYNTNDERINYRFDINQLNELKINARMSHFLEGVRACITDGIKCRCFLKMKISEMLLLLRGYYPKEELREFFSIILSKDVVFSEYVRLRWQKFNSIKELAASMNLTHKQFYTRFLAVFGKTPQRWISENKANLIYHEIISTKKQFKQIAIENGFSTDAQFTRFCKSMLSATPTDLRKLEVHALD